VRGFSEILAKRICCQKKDSILVIYNLKNIQSMNREATLEKLKVIVKPYVQNQEAFDSLTEETDFINDLRINSANLVDVILDIEEKFDIIIDNESMEKMVNVKVAIAIIETELTKK
jgi:acyl carrier protein